MTTIKEICNQTIRDSKIGVKQILEVCKSDKNFRMSIPPQPDDTDNLIIRICDNADKMARALLVMHEALEKIYDEPNRIGAEADEILSKYNLEAWDNAAYGMRKAEAILGGGGVSLEHLL